MVPVQTHLRVSTKGCRGWAEGRVPQFCFVEVLLEKAAPKQIALTSASAEWVRGGCAHLVHAFLCRVQNEC
jgi:hypothetical protein